MTTLETHDKVMITEFGVNLVVRQSESGGWWLEVRGLHVPMVEEPIEVMAYRDLDDARCHAKFIQNILWQCGKSVAVTWEFSR